MNGFEVVFVLIGWIAVGLIMYTVYTNMELRSIQPNIKLRENNKPRFLFFYAPWCPWSKKAKPHWDVFSDDLKRFPATFGGQEISLELIDGDVDPTSIKKFHVSAYPSFKLVTSDGTVYDMSGHPSPEAFREFLSKYVGKEEPMKLKSTL